MSDTESSHDGEVDLFAEPQGYYKPEAQPTFSTHVLRSNEELQVRLVGSNPLWGHMLWNAGRTIADFLEDNAQKYVQERTVLELGAGAGLPSLISSIRGASKVVVTDYPDVELIENLRYNINHCRQIEQHENIEAKGYLWGNDAEPLLEAIPANKEGRGFDTLILADLLFNHSEHQKLVQSIERTLKRSSSTYALVFFTPYRPWLLEKDLAFFNLAKSAGFTVEQILEKKMDAVMFENDPGDETLRRTVFGYELKWESSEA